MDILIATLVVGAVGLVLGLALVSTGRKFRVETDPRESAVRELLPGNNCGACGYAGCDAMAAAIAKGKINACPICSCEAAEQIASLMGVEVQTAARRVAFVRCGGDCEKTSPAGKYVGVMDCRAAALAGLNPWSCTYGCLGYGSCVAVCNYDAISIVDGVAVVDASRCVGCGLCMAACPKGLIELISAGRTAVVRCFSPDEGGEVRKLCSAGCLGCGICAKQCPEEAITVNHALAKVDYTKCAGCGLCVVKCPTHAIGLTE